ncbi:MAG TPA: hypothetical protein VHR27_02965, partial [Blastocatellia bacterium]|nr:hypothetical protein [Blastocatellia bacterium]
SGEEGEAKALGNGEWGMGNGSKKIAFPSPLPNAVASPLALCIEAPIVSVAAKPASVITPSP